MITASELEAEGKVGQGERRAVDMGRGWPRFWPVPWSRTQHLGGKWQHLAGKPHLGAPNPARVLMFKLGMEAPQQCF